MVIFFDLDDTLVDHSSAMQAAARALHRSANVSIDPETFVENWRDAHRRYAPRYSAGELTYEMATRCRIRETVGADLSDERADTLFRDYLEIYEAGCVLLPDVLQSIDDLASARLGIISNG